MNPIIIQAVDLYKVIRSSLQAKESVNVQRTDSYAVFPFQIVMTTE